MRARSGFTLIELMIAASLLSLAVLGLMGLIPMVTNLSETAQDTNLATAAIQQTAEAIRQYSDASFAYVWRDYNSTASDDPNGSGTAPGATFAVSGLYNTAGNTTVGSITFYVNETVTNTTIGLPKDLNGDSDSSDTDVSGSYTILPFTVSVDWKDRAGLQRHLEISSQVVDY